MERDPVRLALLREFTNTVVPARPPDTEKGQALRDAVEDNEISLVQSLVAEGANIEEEESAPPDIFKHFAEAPLCFDCGWTAVYMAARWGHTDILKFLLDAGGNPRGRIPGSRWAPLLAAARANCVEAVKMLLDAGAGEDVLRLVNVDLALDGVEADVMEVLNPLLAARQQQFGALEEP